MHTGSWPYCLQQSKHEHFDDNSPVLLETFVDPRRYAGTCYKAANWIALGHTQGRGKLDRYGQRALPVKAIFVYPLHPDFRAILTGCAPAADAGKPTPSGKEHDG